MIRDVNFGLFILILGTLIAFAAFTAYYQNTFMDLSVEYRTKLSELEKVSNNLKSEKERLNLTSYQLKIKSEREVDLSQKYTNVRGEKEILEKDKAALEAELSKAKIDLKLKSSQLDATKDELSAKEIKLSDADKQITTLSLQISTLKADIKDKESKISAYCSKLQSLSESC